MSGVAPISVYFTAALLAALGMLWIALKLTKHKATRIAGIAWVAAAAASVGCLVIDKTVGVGYTKGLYLSIALTISVGILSGLALRRGR